MGAPARFHKIVGPVLRWYGRHGRSFPWRGIDDPYRILLSEIMLQQTQVNRVRIKYPEFLRRFPSLHVLARASVGDVIVAWRGMGYNNRAVRLHALAQVLTSTHRGVLPGTAEALVALPGIGRYTAHALLSSVHGLPVPIVDVNVRRFFSRVFCRMRSLDALLPERDVWTIAGSVVPRRRAYDWNQALMDFGATVCTARQPLCGGCPVARLCASRRSMQRVWHAARKVEAGLDGVPNRIYRGRVVEQLRTLRGTPGLTVKALGRRIHPLLRKEGGAWLRSLLKGLADDGLITIRRNGRRGVERVTLA